MNKVDRIFEIVEELDSLDAARIAGIILADVDPTRDNLRKFWDQLGDEVKGELAVRAQEWTQD